MTDKIIMRIPILLFLVVGFFLGVANSEARPPNDGKLDVICKDPRTVIGEKRYQELVGNLEKIGAKNVQCFSCYRDPGYQRKLCWDMCKAESCPGRCAKPGYSQHQKEHLVTCDLSGLPKGAPGCQMLKQLCDQKYGGLCGIGGYAGGSFHFGVNDDHFSSWNQCGFLKGGPTRKLTEFRGRWHDILRRIEFWMGGGSGG